MEDALPSSPPLAPTRPGLTRKRTRASEISLSYPSSDPAFFSSDDLYDEGAENYDNERPRKKVQWDGTWWGHGEGSEGSISSRTRAAHTRTTKKAFARNFDSGVWMASDDSDTTRPEVDLVLPVSSSTVPVEPASTNMHPRSPVDLMIERTISDALERPHPHVDLSDIGLNHLPGELLSPLLTVIAPAPHLDAAGSSSPRAYAPLTPEIHLYLSNNTLTSLPTQLFDLENLKVLSLRNNDLTKLPSSIGRLPRLHTLNLSGNHLRYLPSQLLPMLFGADHSIKYFESWSNRLVDPVSATYEIWKNKYPLDCKVFTPQTDGSTHDDDCQFQSAPRMKAWVQMIRDTLKARGPTRHANVVDAYWNDDTLASPVVVSSTPTVYYDPTGIPIAGIPIDEMSDSEIIASLDHVSVTPDAPTHTPSMFEHCLRICAQSSDLPLREMVPADAAPTVFAGLSAASDAVREGPGICSRCHRVFVLARAEWIDFVMMARRGNHGRTPVPRVIHSRDIMVPFMHRVCSWACAQRSKELSYP